MATGDDPTAPPEPVREDTAVYVQGLDDGPIPPPRRGVSRLTVALAVLLIGAAGFMGGVRVQKARASTGGSTSAEAGGGGEGGGHGGGGQADGFVPGGGENGGGAGTAVGQVRLVDGTTIYVADAQGNIVKVTTGPGTAFNKTAPASIADVRPGDSIVVRGQAQPDGTVTASRVADNGASGGSGGGEG